MKVVILVVLASLLIMFSNCTLKAQAGPIHLDALLDSVAIACCDSTTLIIPLTELNIFLWSTGDITDTLFYDGPADTIIYLETLINDTIFYDSIYVKYCSIPNLSEKYICSSELPISV